MNYGRAPMSALIDAKKRSRIVALAALALAIVAYIGVSLFGIDMPVIWGHFGYHYGEYVLRARVILRFHTLVPAHWGGVTLPPVSTYYLHHPALPSLLLAAAFFVFGERAFLIRALSAVSGLFMLFYVWRLARRSFGDYPAAVAALVYATCPFTAVFSALYDGGQIAAPGFLLAMEGWLKHRERPGRGPVLAAIFGTALCGLTEWTPYLYFAFFLPIAFLLPWLGGKRGGPRRLGLWPTQWLAIFMGVTLVLALASHFALAHFSGGLPDLLASYRGRSQSVPASTTVMHQERYIGLYFGAPVYIVTALWAAAVLLRLILRRGRADDLVPFSMLAGWFAYVVIFPNAVNIHSYRLMPLVGFIALAAASLTHDIPASVRWTLARIPPLTLFARPAAAAVGVLGFVVLLAVQVPHSLHALVVSREKSGNEEYPGYDPQIRQFFFASVVRYRIPPDALVLAHRHLGIRAEFVGLIDKEVVDLPSLGHLDRYRRSGRNVYVVWDHDRLAASERPMASALVAAHGIVLIDRFAFVDLTHARPEAEAQRIELGRPTLLYKYFVSHKYQPMALHDGIRQADALWLGLLGVRLVTKDNVPPPAPTKLADLVAYVDFLKARGDAQGRLTAASETLRQGLSPGGALGSIDIVGHRIDASAGTLQLVLSPNHVSAREMELRVIFDGPEGVRQIVAPSPWSSEHGLPYWKPGFLYLWTVRLPAGRATSISVEAHRAGKAPPPKTYATPEQALAEKREPAAALNLVGRAP